MEAEEAQLRRSQASVGEEGVVVVEQACLTWFSGAKGGSDLELLQRLQSLYQISFGTIWVRKRKWHSQARSDLGTRYPKYLRQVPKKVNHRLSTVAFPGVAPANHSYSAPENSPPFTSSHQSCYSLSGVGDRALRWVEWPPNA